MFLNCGYLKSNLISTDFNLKDGSNCPRPPPPPPPWLMGSLWMSFLTSPAPWWGHAGYGGAGGAAWTVVSCGKCWALCSVLQWAALVPASPCGPPELRPEGNWSSLWGSPSGAEDLGSSAAARRAADSRAQLRHFEEHREPAGSSATALL